MQPTNPNTLTIRTPEGIAFPLRLAGPAARFLAWGIDVGVTIVAFMIVAIILTPLQIISQDFAGALSMLAVFVINLGYGILLEWFWRGQTLGKFVLGIRVMDVQGLNLQFSQIVVRNLLRTVDAMPVLYLTGGIAMILSRRSQRLGDLAANTVVVRSRQAPQPDFTQLLPGKYNSFRSYPHLEARLRQRVTPEEADLLIHALLRREDLDPPARVALYTEIATHFQAQVPFPESATLGLSDEQYLRNLLESLFRRPGAASSTTE